MIRLLEDQDIENKQREKEEKEAQAKEEAARLAVEKAAELRSPDWNVKFALVLISAMYMYVGYAMPNAAGNKLGHLLDPKR